MMLKRAYFILLSGNLVIAWLLILILIVALPQTAMADDDANEESNEGPVPLRHRVGLHSTMADWSIEGGKNSLYDFQLAAEIGVLYEWEAIPYFALGVEFMYSRPYDIHEYSNDLQADVFRLGGRLRAMLPLAEDQVELFVLLHGGLVTGRIATLPEAFVGDYLLGGIGLAWWITPNWSLSLGFEAGMEFAGSEWEGYKMFHMVRLPIEVMYRF